MRKNHRRFSIRVKARNDIWNFLLDSLDKKWFLGLDLSKKAVSLQPLLKKIQ